MGDWIALGALSVVVLGQIVGVVIVLTRLAERVSGHGRWIEANNQMPVMLAKAVEILERVERRLEKLEARVEGIETKGPVSCRLKEAANT